VVKAKEEKGKGTWNKLLAFVVSFVVVPLSFVFTIEFGSLFDGHGFGLYLLVLFGSIALGLWVAYKLSYKIGKSKDMAITSVILSFIFWVMLTFLVILSTPPPLGTNEFAIKFTTPSGGIDPNGGCISTSNSDEKTNYQIKGIVKNVRGGFVSGAWVEATGVGYSDVDVTGEDGVFELKSDFLLGGTNYGTMKMNFQKNEFTRKDITVVVKKGTC
jgi:hypothetical protein